VGNFDSQKIDFPLIFSAAMLNSRSSRLRFPVAVFVWAVVVIKLSSDTPAASNPPAAGPALRPLESSEIVMKGAKGELLVGQKTGKGVDGVKLSQHDLEIGSPAMVVAPDGVIHVAFVEKHRTSYAYAIYHRSSSDGGKTWSEGKNLSEDMVGVGVGHCQVLADPANRVYVIWRAGLGPNFAADINPHSGRRHCNLWFRTLENGKWTKAKPLHPLATPAKQNEGGSLSYFAGVDETGHPHVAWNSNADATLHPEVYTGSPNYRYVYNGIGKGEVFQVDLDGSAVSAPREIFFPVVKGLQEKNAYCDGLDTLNGYFDPKGEAHFIALVESVHDPIRGMTRYELIENGKAGEPLDLPELSFHAWMDVPTLLLDAKGNRHIIALNLGGERKTIRDYPVGSDEEPTVIRAAAPVKGTITGFQACQARNGQMIVIIQANDTGELGEADSFVTVSTGGGKWSVPVNVTNNAGRKKFASTQTSSKSFVGVETSYIPGVATAAVDRDGHLLLLMINSERSLVGSVALGVQIAGGSTSTPALRFLRF
jgi:hypothetical protein